MKYNKRIDANQPEIVEAFRKEGWKVQITSACSDLGWDIMVSKGGRLYLVEIKDGEKSASQKKLTRNEENARDAYPNHWILIESVDQIAGIGV